MIVEIFVAQRQAKDPLSDQRADFMLDQFGPAGVLETLGEAIDQTDRPIRRPQQQRPGVRGHRTAVKTRHHAAAFHTGEPEQI